jgi:hypothetical protein
MIDNFSLAVSHGLMLIVAWRLIFRRDLDHEAPPPRDEVPSGWRKGRPRNG